MVEYKEKMAQARKEVEAAQKKLESVDTDGPREGIEEAEQEVMAAQKKLQALMSEELEQLIKEYIREGIRDGSFAAGQRDLGRAERDLEHLDALLKWIKGEFPKIIMEIERARQDCARAPNSKRSSSRTTLKKASQSKLSSQSTRRRDKYAPAYSVLGPTHSSKVSKVSGRKKALLSQELSATRGGILSSVRRTDNGEQVEQQPTSKASLHRSRRIPKSTPDFPSPPPPPRRSVRISGRR